MGPRFCLAGFACLALATAANPLTSQTLSPLPAPDGDALPTIGDVIDRMVERAERQDEAEAELRFESRIVTTIETLDGDGDVSKTERTLHRRYPVENQLFEELIERNGRPLTEDEQERENDKREQFAREARERHARGKGSIETHDERQVRLGWNLIERFKAEVVGIDTIGDESYWVVDFEPREGKLPEETRIDRALNRSSGTLYVARHDYGLKRIDFNMDRSVRYFWGLARLRRATGRLEFERVEPDVWLPKHYNFGIDLRIVFSSRRQRITREWIERRPLAPNAE